MSEHEATMDDLRWIRDELGINLLSFSPEHLMHSYYKASPETYVDCFPGSPVKRVITKMDCTLWPEVV